MTAGIPLTGDTVEWLDQLPVGTVIVDAEGDGWTKNGSDSWWSEFDDRNWRAVQVIRFLPGRVFRFPGGEVLFP